MRASPISWACKTNYHILPNSDVFSFYKEEIAQETANFIHERAAVTEKDAFSALSDVAEEAVGTVLRVRSILEGEKEKEAWERFMAGYTSWHRYSPRYRLNDVFGDQDY